jgi:chemotaxis protein methyltransferase CheR
MITPPGSGDVNRFRSIVARRLGLSFDDAKLGFLAEVLSRRLDAHGQRCEVYLGWLESVQSARDEVRDLARELTVNETYFFRNPDQFQALTQSALPSRLTARAHVRRLSILAAGCASGEEPYSVAMTLRDLLPDPSWVLSIRAVDVNPTMLDKARRARYTAWSLRETPPELQDRWFAQEGQEFVLDPSVRGPVVFEERNLAEDDRDLWASESYDVVFCRNVIMYLTPDHARALMGRIARAMMPGGYLFLGHAETLRGVSQDFHLQHTDNTFYYRRRVAKDHEEPVGAALGAAGPTMPPSLAVLVDTADTWFEAIARAADRIQVLSARPQGAAPSRPAAAALRKTPVWDLGGSLELLEKERFGDALDLVQRLPPESARDPEVLLLRAGLLTHSGQFERAEAVCTDLLQLDELNSGAYYLRALCREGTGDRPGAVEQNRIAAYVDPSFAMPRLHLGFLARRAGDLPAAHVEFGQALLLLRREDAARLLLFGGGFGREALIALCRAELVACGGRP